MESTENREYFEEDVKMDIDEETRLHFLNHSCETCNKYFNSSGALRKHIQYVHTEIRYPCNQCEYKATKTNTDMTHRESIHEGV